MHPPQNSNSMSLSPPSTPQQQPELDPTSQAATKSEFDRGVDRITNFPIDGVLLQMGVWMESGVVSVLSSQLSAGQPSAGGGCLLQCVGVNTRC